MAIDESKINFEEVNATEYNTIAAATNDITETGLRQKFRIANSIDELTIATGVITITKSFHSVDTEADTASDDLVTINGGVAGNILILKAIDSTRTVVCKNGTGNLQLAGSDFSLDNANDTIMLAYDGTNWLELSRSGNGV